MKTLILRITFIARLFLMILIAVTLIITLWALIFSFVSGDVNAFTNIIFDTYLVRIEFTISIFLTIVAIVSFERSRRRRNRYTQMIDKLLSPDREQCDKIIDSIQKELSDQNKENTFEFKFEEERKGIEMEGYKLWVNDKETKVMLPMITVMSAKNHMSLQQITSMILYTLRMQNVIK